MVHFSHKSRISYIMRRNKVHENNKERERKRERERERNWCENVGNKILLKNSIIDSNNNFVIRLLKIVKEFS